MKYPAVQWWIVRFITCTAMLGFTATAAVLEVMRYAEGSTLTPYHPLLFVVLAVGAIVLTYYAHTRYEYWSS